MNSGIRFITIASFLFFAVSCARVQTEPRTLESLEHPAQWVMNLNADQLPTMRSLDSHLGAVNATTERTTQRATGYLTEEVAFALIQTPSDLWTQWLIYAESENTPQGSTPRTVHALTFGLSKQNRTPANLSTTQQVDWNSITWDPVKKRIAALSLIRSKLYPGMTLREVGTIFNSRRLLTHEGNILMLTADLDVHQGWEVTLRFHFPLPDEGQSPSDMRLSGIDVYAERRSSK